MLIDIVYQCVTLASKNIILCYCFFVAVDIEADFFANSETLKNGVIHNLDNDDERLDTRGTRSPAKLPTTDSVNVILFLLTGRSMSLLLLYFLMIGISNFRIFLCSTK